MTKIVAWFVIAPDGTYSVAGGHDFENERPDWLGDCGVYDNHCPSVCKVYRVTAEVDLPKVEEVIGAAELIAAPPPN